MVRLTKLLITGGGGSKVMVKLLLTVPAELVALIITLKVPVTVGVQLIVPVVVLRRSPEGSPEAVKEVGVFVAVIW